MPGVDVISPEGDHGMLPAENLQAGLARGFKLAVRVTSPEGDPGWLPMDKAHDAVGRGFQIGQPNVQKEAAAPETYSPERHPIRDAAASLAGPAYALAGNPDVREFGKQMLQKATNPEMLAGATGAGMLYNQGKQIYSLAKGDPQPQGVEALAGAVGVDPKSVAKNAQTQNVPGLVADAAFPIASMEATKGISEAAPKAVENLRPAGPQTSVMPRIGNMPLKTVNAAEGIFQAAAPTGTNVKFRASVYTALPDLAEVARKVNLDEAKGGIINPDMRVRATVDAIDAHLADMYKTELKPQIDAHAGESVQPNLSYDAKAGLRFLSKSSGQVGDRFLAAKALNGQPMTVAELDRLRLVTNEELTPLRNMTPQDRAMAQVTNKKMAGLQALDGNVGESLNNYLQSKGEPGIKGYEQRYAALSDVRNGLRPRINAEELKRSIDLGVVGKGIKAVTGGKSGIASASQSAVADVNVGKKLQSSMQTLAESNLKPNRAIRQVSPMSSQSPPEQSQ